MERTPLRKGILVALFAVGLVLAFQLFARPRGNPAAATTLVADKAPAGREIATIAGGCFWSMEAIFKQLKGVDKVEPGYSGGAKPNPSYEYVETGRTGYAETAQITFDPKVISYHDLLRVFFTVRNPTTPNQQGNDVGPQYRSVIFYRNPQQQKVAQQVMAEITREKLWPAPLVTKLAPFRSFYRAEGYHLDYYRHHPDEPYCRSVIAPEIAEFRDKFKSRLKE